MTAVTTTMLTDVMLIIEIILIHSPTCLLQNPGRTSSVTNSKDVTAMPVNQTVNEDYCSIEKYPFLVSIYTIGRTYCAGTLISYEWIVTAGHCVESTKRNPEKTKIRAGFNSTGINLQYRKVKEVLSYKKFKSEFMYHVRNPELRYDIALIRVDIPFVRTDTLRPAVLPTPGYSNSCDVGTVFGNGLTKVSFTYRHRDLMEDLTEPLKCVDLDIVDNEVCAKYYNSSVIDDSIVCTMGYESERDGWKGDSGGPLICNDSVIIGIISYEPAGAKRNKPVTYTKVESYLDFINHDAIEVRVRSRSTRRSHWKYLLQAVTLVCIAINQLAT